MSIEVLIGVPGVKCVERGVDSRDCRRSCAFPAGRLSFNARGEGNDKLKSVELESACWREVVLSNLGKSMTDRSLTVEFNCAKREDKLLIRS